MNTEKLKTLANTIINYSLKLKENERVQVSFTEEATPLVEELIKEAKVLLDFIQSEHAEYDDPLANAEVLCDCVKKGYIDAVHILKNEKYRGTLKTKIQDGKCLACDPNTRKHIDEQTRLTQLKV